eukprot:31034-Pelagococcus_subviridis.AAC.5
MGGNIASNRRANVVDATDLLDAATRAELLRPGHLRVSRDHLLVVDLLPRVLVVRLMLEPLAGALGVPGKSCRGREKKLVFFPRKAHAEIAPDSTRGRRDARRGVARADRVDA